MDENRRPPCDSVMETPHHREYFDGFPFSVVVDRPVEMKNIIGSIFPILNKSVRYGYLQSHTLNNLTVQFLSVKC